MLNLRYIFRLSVAFFKRFKILILISIALGVLMFSLFKFLIPSLDFSKNERIGLTGRYTVSNLPTSVLDLIGDGLTKLDKDGSPVPDLASSWETTDKGKTWIFTLKDNVYWQNGEKVTSKDINYQFTDVTIERPDDKTIVFKLLNTYSAFPVVVSKPAFKSGLLGTGEWKVNKISLNGSTVEQISLSSKQHGNMTYKFYPTEDRTKIAFELGEVDRINDLFSISPFNTWPKVKITDAPNTGEYVAIFFNTQDGVVKEKDIRQALSYAIDKNKLGGMRAISPISIDSWAYNPQVKRYDYDPSKAKQMIDDYKDTSKINDISINLSVSPLLLDKAEIVAEDWKAVGINVNLQVVSEIPNDFQAFMAILDVPEDPDQYSLWHSTQQSTNITRYQNVRIDKLLEDGRTEMDVESRKKIYLDFQRYLLEDAPAVFLYYPSVYSVSRD